MKLLKTVIVLSIIMTVVVINWNCKNDNLQIPTNTNTYNQNDGTGTDGVRFTIQEYAYITPPPGYGEPYYGFIGVFGGAISHQIYPVGYTNSSFTTPRADRTVNGYRYQTQHFKAVMEANNLSTCVSCYCAGRFYLIGVFPNPIDHFYCNGNCTECGNGNKKCYWIGEQDNLVLTENTTYNFWVGSDCIVQETGEWEIGN